MLCDPCRDIFRIGGRDGDFPYPDAPHHDDRASLEKAIAQDCFICKALLSEIWDWDEIQKDATRQIFTAYNLSDREGPILLTVNGYSPPAGTCYTAREFIIEPCSSPEIKDLVRSPPPNRDTINMARGWLQSCMEQHPECRQAPQWTGATGSSEVEYRPRRLVDIGSPGSTVWRVVPDDKNLEDGASYDYATLSHRWSNTASLRLLEGNINQLQEEPQSVEVLPRSFQDAIVVAHSLEIRFLWIDCLCIIQDSAQDWEEQSQQMRLVYSNSVLNISATGVADNTFGFLDILTRPSPTLPIVEPVWTVDRGPHYVIDKYFWWSQVTSQPLMKRGWVYQERFLAPRVLHFGAEQIFWECRRLDLCETFPIALPSICQRWDHTHFKHLPHVSRDPGTGLPTQADDNETFGKPDATNPSRLVSFWCRQIDNYTRTSLTMESDKLPALSGLVDLALAMFPSPETTDPPRFLAGLFDTDLPLMLEWHTVAGEWEFPSQLPTCRPAGYRAPSWSWASIDGRVAYHFLPRSKDSVYNRVKDYVPLISDVKASTTLVHQSSPLGRVSDGFIDLTGYFIPTPKNVPLDRQYQICPDTVDHAALSGEEWCLVLRCTGPYNDGKQPPWYHVTGLILKPVQTDEEQARTKLRRIGMFSIHQTGLEMVKNMRLWVSPKHPLQVEFLDPEKKRKVRLI